MSDRRYYVTTAIPYANGKPHLGHAIEAVYADVLTRYWAKKITREHVFLCMGMDEHGQKIATAAAVNERTPQEQVDLVALEYEQLFQLLGIENSDFVRTSQERHTTAAQEFWRRALKSGDIEKDIYEGLYCVGCEAYKTEKELVDGLCPDHKVAPEKVKEENYFFRLSRYQKRLLEFYEQHPDFVLPKAKFNEMKELVKAGLEDIPISREKAKLSWGIPVPDDENHVMYVWFDALVNYLTGVGFGDASTADAFARLWPADMHIIGKDINRFHSILWPAMLMAAELPLPQHIGVHGHVTVDGQKMSKSIGNVIDPMELIAQYGAEPVRYFFMREIPFQNDGDFSHTRMHEIYTAHLANGLGNLLSRVTNMIEKYCDGVLDPAPKEKNFGEQEMVRYNEAIESLHFHTALEIVWRIIDDTNQYLEQQKPWELAKQDPEQLRIVLAHALYVLRYITECLEPFMPETAGKLKTAVFADIIQKVQPLFPR